MKYWRPDKPFQTVMQQRHVVRIGAVMRPFGEIVNIEMHLDPSFCLRTVTPNCRAMSKTTAEKMDTGCLVEVGFVLLRNMGCLECQAERPLLRHVLCYMVQSLELTCFVVFCFHRSQDYTRLFRFVS